jgi:coenzyme F420-reducing hydrogenase delta subunit
VLQLNIHIPKIYIFHCATSYDQEELLKSYSPQAIEIKMVSLPCSGKLDILYLTKAFDTGADGAAILICKEGECHYMEGNMRARKRVQAVDELLEEAGLGKGRTKIIQMGDKGIAGALHELEDFLLRIKTMVENAPSLPTSQTE